MKILHFSLFTALVASAPLLFGQENERQELSEILKKAEAAQAEGRSEEAEKLRQMARKHEVRQAIHQTEQELEEARKAGNADAVKKLEERLGDIRGKAQQANEAGREHGDRGPRAGGREGNPEQARQQKIHEAMKQTQQDLEEARKSGDAEKMKALEGRMADIRAKAEQSHQAQRERGEREDRNPPQAKLRHLREAIEHLRLAGLQEPAESLAEQAEKMEQMIRQSGGAGPGNHGPQLHGRPDRGPRGGERPEGGRRGGDRPQGGPREEVMKLQQQVQELNNRLERLERGNR